MLGLVGSAVWWRSRPARPGPPSPLHDAMPILAWALHACYGVNHVGEEVTTVSSGKNEVTARVRLAYRRPGLTWLRYLDGPLKGVEVWEDSNRTYRYLPSKDRLEVAPVAPSRPPQLERRLDLVRANYEAVLEGSTAIAGRQAHQIALRPRHPGNPWKRLWIDEETYLMLGSEDYDAQDRRLRSTRFVSLKLDTAPESAFQPKVDLLKRVSKRVTWNPAADEAPASAAQIARRVGFAVLLPKSVPPGYQLLGSFLVPCQCGRGDELVRSQFTDGLNTISVFQCGHPCARGSDCMVGSCPQAVAVRLARGEDTFLFVGEVDRSMLEQMAQSVPPRPGHGR